MNNRAILRVNMGYQRLSDKAKRAIVILAEFEGWKKAELARVFRVTPSRISQIVNDYYGERMKIGIEGSFDKVEWKHGDDEE